MDNLLNPNTSNQGSFMSLTRVAHRFAFPLSFFPFSVRHCVAAGAAHASPLLRLLRTRNAERGNPPLNVKPMDKRVRAPPGPPASRGAVSFAVSLNPPHVCARCATVRSCSTSSSALSCTWCTTRCLQSAASVQGTERRARDGGARGCRSLLRATHRPVRQASAQYFDTPTFGAGSGGLSDAMALVSSGLRKHHKQPLLYTDVQRQKLRSPCVAPAHPVSHARPHHPHAGPLWHAGT